MDYHEYSRDLTCIPKELLSKFAPLKPQLTLWQLKSDKNKKPEIEAEIKEYTKLQPGCFFTLNLGKVHRDLLSQKIAPTVYLENSMIAASLSVRLSGTENAQLEHIQRIMKNCKI